VSCGLTSSHAGASFSPACQAVHDSGLHQDRLRIDIEGSTRKFCLRRNHPVSCELSRKRQELGRHDHWNRWNLDCLEQTIRKPWQSRIELVAPPPSMQGGRIKVQTSLHVGLMEPSWRSNFIALCLITITLRSPLPAAANESNHKASTITHFNTHIACQDFVRLVSAQHRKLACTATQGQNVTGVLTRLCNRSITLGRR